MREQKSSTAEVDFVTTVDANIVPIEVKAGKTGRLKSLQIFLSEKQATYGVHVSQMPFGMKDNIIAIPLYMVGEIERIIKNIYN